MRKIFLALGIIFLAFLIFIFIRELTSIVVAIREAKWHWLLAAVFLQAGTYIFLTFLFYDIFLFFGHKINFLHLFKISFSLNYLNQILPAFGVSGLYFFILVLRKNNISAGKSITAGIFYYIFIHLTFLFLLVYAFAQLFLSRQINKFEVIATFASVAVALALVFLFIFLFKKRERFKKILSWFIWPVQKFALSVSGDKLQKEELERFLNVDFLIADLQKNMTELNHAKLKILLGLLYSLLIHILDAVTLFVLFLAFNAKISFSAAIIGFVFGSLFAFVSFIPAGIGIEEVSRGLILNWLGTPLGVAMLASVVFRALTFWINIPLGIAAYRDLVKSLK